MTVKCPRCRHDNPADTKFCGNCAEPLDRPSSSPRPGPQGPAALVTETLQAALRELATGTTFAGRYQVIEELGRGGMGRVYKVHDTELNEKIALKLLRPEVAVESEAVERFRNELKSARQVSHKNVCRMYDIGRAEGAPYITMEYVHGEDLKRLIRKIGLMPSGRTVSIARQIAEGLAEAHAHGVVHRDLKPQNIMVDEGGNVRIMDFGIARSLEKKGITGAGIMIGTPEYMSPEQVEGKPVDARSDIYSLGIILYEMMTGRVPFEGDTPFTIGVKHKSEAPRDPRVFNPQIPEDLARLILRCLEKDKDTRFQDAGELIGELGRIEAALPTTERVIPKHRPPRTSKEITVTFDVKKVLVPAVAGVLLVAAALVLWLVVLKKNVVRPASGKPLLAVLYFKNNTGDAGLDVWRRALPGLVIDDLYQSRYIDVASDSQIYGVLRALDLTDAEAYAPEDLKRVAQKTGATHILQGTMTQAGTNFRINTTLEDTSTGEVIASEMVQGQGTESFHVMVDELTWKIKSGLRLTTKEIATDIDREVGKITSASPEAYKLYAQGRIYHLGLDYKESIALMEKAVAIDPEFAMAYRSMSAAYSNLGFRAKADECIRKALEFKDRISDRERWIIEGNLYYGSSATYGEAIEAFNTVLDLYPDDPLANNGLGLVYGYIEEPEKAVGYYEVYARQRGAPYLAIGNLAGTYAELGQYEKARDVVLEYLKSNPDTAAAHLDLADFHIYEGRYDAALAEADKAFALAPTNSNVLNTMGTAAMLKGDFVRAEEEIKKIIEAAVKANMPWRRALPAAFYMSQGRFTEALRQISQAKEAAREMGEPSWLGSFNFFAVLIYLGAGRIDDARQAAEQSYKIASAAGIMGIAAYGLWGKGVAQVSSDSLVEAEKTADELEALIRTGMNKRAMRGVQGLRARIATAKGDTALAVENAKAAVESLRPQSDYSNPDGYYWQVLAEAYEAAGEPVKAREVYEGLQNLTRGRVFAGNLYALSFYRVGLIEERLGDKAAARRNYERFLEIWKDADPGLPEPVDARRRLASLDN